MQPEEHKGADAGGRDDDQRQGLGEAVLLGALELGRQRGAQPRGQLGRIGLEADQGRRDLARLRRRCLDGEMAVVRAVPTSAERDGGRPRRRSRR